MKFLCLQISEKNVVGPATLGISLLVGSVTIIRPRIRFSALSQLQYVFGFKYIKKM